MRTAFQIVILCPEQRDNVFLEWSRIFTLRASGCQGSVLWGICHEHKLFARVLVPGLPPLINCPPTGLEDYMKRYGEGIRRVLTSFGPVPDFSGEGAKSIVNVSLKPCFNWACQDTDSYIFTYHDLWCTVQIESIHLIKQILLPDLWFLPTASVEWRECLLMVSLVLLDWKSKVPSHSGTK